MRFDTTLKDPEVRFQVIDIDGKKHEEYVLKKVTLSDYRKQTYSFSKTQFRLNLAIQSLFDTKYIIPHLESLSDLRPSKYNFQALPLIIFFRPRFASIHT